MAKEGVRAREEGLRRVRDEVAKWLKRERKSEGDDG